MISFLNSLANFTLGLPRSVKSSIVVLADILMCVLSIWVALNLQWQDFFINTADFWSPTLEVVWVALCLAIPIFLAFGLYRAIYRYIGIPSMTSMTGAMLLYAVLFSGVFAFYGIKGVPRKVGLIQPLVLFIFIGSSRILARVWLGRLTVDSSKKSKVKRVLIYGAGSAGRQLVSAISLSQEMVAVGFLDDDDRLHGHVLNGIPISNPNELIKVISKTTATDVFLALPSISRGRRNEILKNLSLHKLQVQTLPGLNDLVSGKVSLNDIRELDIDDLLGREPVKPNFLLLNRNTNNKRVLVTGAGGSIGSELCCQILKTNPKQLLLVEMSEFALYQIHQKLQRIIESTLTNSEIFNDSGTTEIVPLLASVCDEKRMQEILGTWKPHTVYHAAAYKHVPLVEHNPVEGLRNNVWGTWVCAQASLASGVKNFVLISTDKAVRPTNIMGASKRLAEMLLQALAEIKSTGSFQDGLETAKSTCFSMVRFGNVLGSSGSVVPLFREQIKNGGPITLTHPEITRYFMSITEATQLVLQAGAMATGGDVFVLDMGQPVKIFDLAHRMVELSGLTIKNEINPGGDIEITTTGLRPGEKLYEELLIGDNPQSTQHPGIMKANELFLAWEQLTERLKDLEAAMKLNNVHTIRAQLQQLIPGYQPSGEVVDWIHLANASELISEVDPRVRTNSSVV